MGLVREEERKKRRRRKLVRKLAKVIDNPMNNSKLSNHEIFFGSLGGTTVNASSKARRAARSYRGVT